MTSSTPSPKRGGSFGTIADGLVAPSRALLGRLRLAWKFTLVAVVLLAPLAFVLQRYVTTQQASEDFSALEESGMEYVVPAFALEQALVDARSAAVAGDEIPAEAVNAAVDAVTAVDQQLGTTLATKDAWSTLRAQIEQTLGDHPADATEAYDSWTAVVDGSVALISSAADGSNLTLDPDLNSFYVMDISTTKAPALLAAVGATIDLGALDQRDDAVAERLIVAHVRIDDAVAAIDTGLGKSIGATSDDTIVSELTSAQGTLADAAGSAASDAVADLERLRDVTITVAQTATRSLSSFLQVRIDGIAAKRQLTVVVSIVAVIVAIWLFAGFYQAITRGLRKVRTVLKAAATGDLTARVTDYGNEELGEMSVDLNHALDGVAETIAAVTRRTAAVVTSSTSLTEVGRALHADATRAVSNADSVADLARHLQMDTESTLREVSSVRDVLSEVTDSTGRLDGEMQAVASASNELTAAVREVARVADQTQQRAAAAVEQVTVATKVVSGLTSAADEIGGIVELIEDIAEQTNLLALNATVEAARAGEAGRSFAVVAGEVKNLANATTAATDRIRASILAVQHGSGAAAEAINSIVGAIDGISEGQMTVAAAVEEEMAMADEIGRAVSRSAIGINDIKGSITSIHASLESVKSSSQSVSALADRAATAGAEMAMTARGNVGAAQRTGDSADELAATAAALEGAVARFTLDPSTRAQFAASIVVHGADHSAPSSTSHPPTNAPDQGALVSVGSHV